MWDAIAAFIKTFGEKYLIPLVISIVVALATIILLPSDYWMISKYGVLPFGIAITGISFLVVITIRHFYNLIKNNIYEASDRRYREEHEQIQIEKIIKEFWKRIDRYSPEERKMIRDLVESGNQPISTNAYFYSPESLSESFLMVSTTVRDEQNQYFRVYKLREEYYQILKCSVEKYNKISNFE